MRPQFYGTGAVPAPGTTYSIFAGQQLVIRLSEGGGGIAAAPGFQGYIVANCAFPLARGTSRVFEPGGPSFGQDAQIVTTPRSTSTPQYLLFPFVSTTAFNTTIAVADTTEDPFGTAAASGPCGLNFYGANAPAPISLGAVTAGSEVSAQTSAIAAGFQGYAIASCTFPDAVGVGILSTAGTVPAAMTIDPELLTVPRSTATTSLRYPAVTNQNGLDSSLVIANASADPIGTTAASGACTRTSSPTSFRASRCYALRGHTWEASAWAKTARLIPSR